MNPLYSSFTGDRALPSMEKLKQSTARLQEQKVVLLEDMAFLRTCGDDLMSMAGNLRAELLGMSDPMDVAFIDKGRELSHVLDQLEAFADRAMQLSVQKQQLDAELALQREILSTWYGGLLLQ